MKICIYLLRDPRTNEPKYVGSTTNLNYIRRTHPARWAYHSYDQQKTEWIKELVRLKLRPIVEFITQTTNKNVHWKKQVIIAYLKSKCKDLINKSFDEGNEKRSKQMKILWDRPAYRNKQLKNRTDNILVKLNQISEHLNNLPISY